MVSTMTPKEFFEKFPSISVDEWDSEIMQRALKQLNVNEISSLLMKTDLIAEDFIRDNLGDHLLDIRKDV
jgi:hypothetical protein